MSNPWLGWTCGHFAFCQPGRENLCDQAMFTGCHLDGGYAENLVADQRVCFPTRSLLCTERRNVSGDGFGICLGKCMIHRQHRRTVGALPGLLKHQDLMAHIAGMLARHPWNHPLTPPSVPWQALHAGTPLSGDPWRKITSPRVSDVPLSACMARWLAK